MEEVRQALVAELEGSGHDAQVATDSLEHAETRVHTGGALTARDVFPFSAEEFIQFLSLSAERQSQGYLITLVFRDGREFSEAAVVRVAHGTSGPALIVERADGMRFEFAIADLDKNASLLKLKQPAQRIHAAPRVIAAHPVPAPPPLHVEDDFIKETIRRMEKLRSQQEQIALKLEKHLEQNSMRKLTRPKYIDDGRHSDPTQAARLGKTLLPPDAAELYHVSLPNKASKGRTWFAWSKDCGCFYRYQGNQVGSGIEVHWNGMTTPANPAFQIGARVQEIPIDAIPKEVKQAVDLERKFDELEDKLLNTAQERFEYESQLTPLPH
ncbi:MAG: hypothetical protein ACXWP5_03945 [Bdellovibrionota bacterium]